MTARSTFSGSGSSCPPPAPTLMQIDHLLCGRCGVRALTVGACRLCGTRVCEHCMSRSTGYDGRQSEQVCNYCVAHNPDWEYMKKGKSLSLHTRSSGRTMIKKRKFLRPNHWGPELREDPIEAENESQKFTDDSGVACGACLPTSRRQPSDALLCCACGEDSAWGNRLMRCEVTDAAGPCNHWFHPDGCGYWPPYRCLHHGSMSSHARLCKPKGLRGFRPLQGPQNSFELPMSSPWSTQVRESGLAGTH